MGAAAEDLNLGERHDGGSVTKEIGIERYASGPRRGMEDCHGCRDQGVGAETSLVGCAVESDQYIVDALLVARVASAESPRDLAVDIPNCRHHVGTTETGATVAQIDCLAATGRGAGRRDRPPHGATSEHYFGLDGRPAARIPDAATTDGDDVGRAHA